MLKAPKCLGNSHSRYHPAQRLVHPNASSLYPTIFKLGMSNNTGNLGLDLRGVLPRASVIALTDRPGNRKPIRELIENLYLKVEDGEIVCRPVGGGGSGPGSGLTPSFLVPPPDSLLGSIGTDETKYSAEGHSHLLNISPTALPKANGVASIGNGYTYADIYHTHPETPASIPPDPAVTTATLYTAYVGDSNYHEVKYLMSYGEGLGFNMLLRRLHGCATLLLHYVQR